MPNREALAVPTEFALLSGESLIRRDLVLFEKKTGSAALTLQGHIGIAYLTTNRIVFVPPALPGWHPMARFLRDLVFRQPRVTALSRPEAFDLADITLLRPTLSTFQVRFDGWTVTLIEKVLPWETPVAQEVQSAFFAMFETAWQSAHSSSATLDERS